MPINILIAPSGLKESLGVNDAVEAIAAGVRIAMPEAHILRAADGRRREGFTEVLVESTGGALRRLNVTGPVGIPVLSLFGFLGASNAKTAVIEIAAAAGLRLVPRDRRESHPNPQALVSGNSSELRWMLAPSASSSAAVILAQMTAEQEWLRLSACVCSMSAARISRGVAASYAVWRVSIAQDLTRASSTLPSTSR
jgi:hypothetical protein